MASSAPASRPGPQLDLGWVGGWGEGPAALPLSNFAIEFLQVNKLLFGISRDMFNHFQVPPILRHVHCLAAPSHPAP